MDKNLAAFLDDGAFTVRVAYQQSGDNAYKYVANDKSLEVGDWVVVTTTTTNPAKADAPRRSVIRPDVMHDIEDYAALTAVPGLAAAIKQEDILPPGQRLSIAQIVAIDDGVDIQPNDQIEYKWVVQKLNLAPYFYLLDRNRRLQATVADAYKRNLRKSFAERILGDLEEGPRKQLAALLNKDYSTTESKS